MTICKFFLQGTCKFGDNCKFEHHLNNDHTYTNSSVLLHNYPTKQVQGSSNVDTNTLVKSVVNDMTSTEKGGQWLLSSYAPFKEKPAFPGFEDYSMEEIRYLFYEAAKSGTIEQFKQNLQMMLQQAVMKIKALQNPSPDAVNMLKSIYNTPPSSSLNSNQPPFNAAQSNQIFANPQSPQRSIFGASSQSTFGGTNPPTNVFGNPQPNVFSGPNNSIFGGGQNTPYGNQQPAPTTKSIFVNTQPAPNFGNPIFGAQPVYPNQPQSTFPQNAFNHQPQPNIFQSAPNNQFGASNQFPTAQTPVPQPAPTLAEAKPAFQHSANIFGNLAPQLATPSVFGETNQARPNEDFYSKLEELTEEEIKWFQNDDLDIRKIPTKPPAYEMCFKVQ